MEFQALYSEAIYNKAYLPQSRKAGSSYNQSNVSSFMKVPGISAGSILPCLHFKIIIVFCCQTV